MRKAPLIGIAILLSPAIAVLVLVLLLAGGAGGSDDDMTTTGASQCIVKASTAKGGTTQRPQVPLNPQGKQSQPSWNEEQTKNAAIITNVARTRNLKPRAAVIAVATAMQESTLKRDPEHRDLDSRGLFQQRPSQGWGTVEQVLDPIYSSNKFYDGLVKIPNWDTKNLAHVAQGVQRSAFPDEYAKWETSAGKLVAQVWGADVIDCEQPADSGKSVKASGAWQAPVGVKSSHNYSAGGSMWSSGTHTGVDFPVATGTELHAVGNATVTEAGWGGRYGNNIVLKMTDGTYTQYAHLSRVDVKVNQKVTTGQVIGLTGATGNVTGPHLHFEARTGPAYGSDIDPVKYMRERGITI